MPGAKSDDKEKKVLERFHIEQRRALNNAYGSIVGSQTSDTFQAFTFEEAVFQLIEEIDGKGTQLRPNQLGRVDQTEDNVKKAVEELKQVPSSQFVEADEEDNVNTA
jgi:hypothetical protein